MKNKALFTSYRQDWRTPKKLLESLEKEFGKMFDPCPSNAKFNGLVIDWEEVNFVNPPYDSKIQDKWIKKCYEEWKKGKTIILLIPARTDTYRWHDYIFPYATEIRFLKGRLKFDEGGGTATFPSAIIIFRGNK